MWNPQRYLAFRNHRERPARDLLAHVHAESARRVVDLGCGAGNLTSLLTERWPEAVVEASDSSLEMVDAARSRGVDAHVQDAGDWMPAPDADVVMCNAVLQWVPGHVDLLRRWLPALPGGAWFALQVPGNFQARSHQTIYRLVDEPRWRHRLGGVLRDPDSVLSPTGYADVVADLGCEVDAWETTYLHRLEGEDPVLDWLRGTGLRPIREALDDERWERFLVELGPRLREAYPRRADGTTWFPFRRIFVVAHRLADAVGVARGV
jgi:trans-aconitate 2-methyltransferase